MRLFKLNKSAHWWKKQKRDWAIRDKEGVWWVIPGAEMPREKLKNIKTSKKIKQSSMLASSEKMILILLAGALGISLALNVVYYILR